jgi:hypothetical protein
MKENLISLFLGSFFMFQNSPDTIDQEKKVDPESGAPRKRFEKLQIPIAAYPLKMFIFGC